MYSLAKLGDGNGGGGGGSGEVTSLKLDSLILFERIKPAEKAPTNEKQSRPNATTTASLVRRVFDLVLPRRFKLDIELSFRRFALPACDRLICEQTSSASGPVGPADITHVYACADSRVSQFLWISRKK